MGRLKSLARDSVAYGISSIVSRFLNFLLVPFYTHVLTPTDMGVFTLVYSLVAVLAVVFQMGLDSAYLRQSADLNEVGRKSLFRSAFLGQAVVALLLGTAFWLSSSVLNGFFSIPSSHHELMAISAMILFTDTIQTSAFAHLRLTRNAWRFALIKLSGVLVNIAMNLTLLLYFRIGVEGVFWANLIASAFCFVLLLPTILSQFRFLSGPSTVSSREPSPTAFASLSSLLVLGLPLVPAGLLGMVNEMAGRWFLGRLDPAQVTDLYPNSQWSTLDVVGIQGANWKLGVIGLLVAQMYRMSWQPFYQQHSKDADAPQLFGRTLILLLLGFGAICIPLLLMLDWIVAIPVGNVHLIQPAYWPGLSLVPWVVFAYGIEAWFIHFTLGVYLKKQTGFLMKCNAVGAITTLGGNYLLLNHFGMMAAPIASILSWTLMAFLLTRKSQELYWQEIAWNKVILIIAWILGGCILAALVLAHPPGFIMRVGIVLAYVSTPIWLGLLNKGYYQSLARLLKR